MSIARHLLLGSFVGVCMALPSPPAVAQSQIAVAKVAIDFDLGTIIVEGDRFHIVRRITLGHESDVGDITDDCGVAPS